MERVWAITGGQGQLGQSLTSLFESRSDSFHAWSRQDLDIGDADQVQQRVSALAQEASTGKEAIVINAGAFTKVDLCESEREAAMRANAQGPRRTTHKGLDRGLGLT